MVIQQLFQTCLEEYLHKNLQNTRSCKFLEQFLIKKSKLLCSNCKPASKTNIISTKTLGVLDLAGFLSDSWLTSLYCYAIISNLHPRFPSVMSSLLSQRCVPYFWLLKTSLLVQHVFASDPLFLHHLVCLLGGHLAQRLIVVFSLNDVKEISSNQLIKYST